MVTTPDDDTPQTFTPFSPAMPSRAAGEAPLPPEPQRGDLRDQTYAPVRPRKAKKKTQRLLAREIKRITKTRSKNLAKQRSKPAKKKPTTLRTHTVHPAEPESRNRPLEAKNRLSAVLTAMAGMSRVEATTFTGIMQHMEAMARPARKRVIEALAQVYS